MIRIVTLPLSLVMLAGALSLRVDAAAPKNAEEEAARRQAAIIETRLALEKAQNVARQGDLSKALKAYEDAYSAAQRVAGKGVERALTDIVSGLSAVKIQLAQAAAARLDYTTALDHLSRVLKIDPQNGTAISLKQSYDKAATQLRGRVPSPETLSRIPQITEDKVKTSTLVQDGRILFEAGRYSEAEAKLKQAIGQDPSNVAAYYYLDLIKSARYNEEARKRELTSKEAIVDVESKWNPPVQRELLPKPNPMALTNLVHTGKGRQAIYQRLNEVRIPEVLFDGLPLGEVIKFLSDEARKHDSLKRGINFIINSFADAGGAGAITVDPATGAAIPAPPSEPINLDTVTIKINPAIQDVRLADLLDAIIKVADKPIKYSVEDYAIVFSQRRPEPVQLFTRRFKVDPDTFVQGLESVSGISFGSLDTGGGGGQGGQGGGRGGQGGRGGGQDDGGGQGDFIIPRVQIALSQQGNQGGGGLGGGQGQGGQQGSGITGVTSTNLTSRVQDLARQFFIAAGVNLAPPANVFWNDRAGVLFVRASLLDLDLVEEAIQVLNTAPPQITIEVKFAEITQSDTKALGFDWFLGGTSLNGGRIIGQGGTQPSLTGPTSPGGIPQSFPGGPQLPNTVQGGALFPGQASTLIQQSRADQLLTSGLRNIAGANSATGIPAVGTLTGILTDPQFRVVIRALEQRGGVDLLSAPKVTTLSGRQTQIAIVDIITIVSGVNLNQNQGNQNAAQNVTPGAFTPSVVGTTVNFNTQPLPFGPVLDVIPYVAADGYTIHMTIIPTLTEFLGYDDPGAFVPQAQSAAGDQLGTPLTAQLPLPRLRARQLVTTATVWDGQTVVLGGLIAEDVSKIKDKVPVLGDVPLLGRFFRSEGRTSSKRNLVIFVTPTIIDPAGNRVHNDADLPFAQSATPAQRGATP